MIYVKTDIKTKYNNYHTNIQTFNNVKHLDAWESKMIRDGHKVIGTDILPVSINMPSNVSLTPQQLRECAEIIFSDSIDVDTNNIVQRHDKKSAYWLTFDVVQRPMGQSEKYHLICNTRKNTMRLYDDNKKIVPIINHRKLLNYLKSI